MNKKFTARSLHDFVVKSVEKKAGGLQIAGYANTVTKDRVGDIIVPSAWTKGIDNFKKNPILLYQHDPSKPIGRVTDCKVDKTGLFVEAFISDAAEEQFKIHTLIRDDVLKAFSVGFRVLDQKYDNSKEASMITDVELLEISVVTIPANQDSLFSLRKSFGSEEEYKEWVKSFYATNSLTVGTTSLTDHYHSYEIDEKGVGRTTWTSHGHAAHTHEIKDNQIADAKDHVHTIRIKDVLVDNTEEELTKMVEADIKTLDVAQEAVENAVVAAAEVVVQEPVQVDITLPEPVLSDDRFPLNGHVVRLENKRYKITKRATPSSPVYHLNECDIEGKENETVVAVKASDLLVINTWDIGSDFDLHVIKSETPQELDRSEIAKDFEQLVNMTEWELYQTKSEIKDLNSHTKQQLNKLLNLKSTQVSEWTDTNYVVAKQFCDIIKHIEVHGFRESSDNTILLLSILGHKVKSEEPKEEKIQMAEQNIDKPIVIAGGSVQQGTEENAVEISKASASIQVSEPNEMKLVNAAGAKAVEIAEKDAVDRLTKADLDELRQLKSEIVKHKQEIANMSTQKFAYQAQKQASPYTAEQLADAYFVTKAMAANKGYHNDDEGMFNYSKTGMKVKAVTAVDAFLTNFSTEIQKQMEINLIIAPMLRRIPVDAKNFRIPVADEDTDGDVAQFASGTYATGIADATNVPTSNQHTIKAVNFTPHKFMATTHVAKDEEEDTLIPLMPFLREATARRMARAIDKSLLRGDGTLTGFTAQPTNTITVGGGYASVIKGIATLAQNVGAQTLVVNTGASVAATPSNIASARAKLGRYGLRVGDNLVYLTTIEGYNELVQTADFRTVDTFGPQATYHTGVIGSIYGIPVQVTEFLDNKGSSANIIGCLFYKPGFVVAERRSILVESQYEPRQQVTAIYLSNRWDMHALTTDSTNGALNSTYTMACILSSS
jgi:HK97 family phage prohead protease/HK97 family phage major capsid protein